MSLRIVAFSIGLMVGISVVHAGAMEDCEKKSGEVAIEGCTEFIRQNPRSDGAYDNRGVEYTHKGEYDRAIADFDKALELNPSGVMAYDNRGAAYYSKGEYDRAIADFDKALGLDPKYAKAYNNRGVAYDNKGEYDRAIADEDKAIALSFTAASDPLQPLTARARVR
jgi:tetratricopeptide (TPR) repeat protein